MRRFMFAIMSLSLLSVPAFAKGKHKEGQFCKKKDDGKQDKQGMTCKADDKGKYRWTK